MCGFVVDCDGRLSASQLAETARLIAHRGPDHNRQLPAGAGNMHFHRLAIMGPDASGHQPFHSLGVSLVCNGEIYNHQTIRTALPASLQPQSASDCAVLIPGYRLWGLQGLIERLDGEFALVLFDHESGEWMAARDPVGIRPLFIGEDDSGRRLLSSEGKALSDIDGLRIKPFAPGHLMQGRTMIRYTDAARPQRAPIRSRSKALKAIRETLTEAVRKRLDADVPLGGLLSGGLDSSLVCAIAQAELGRPLPSFATGLEHNPIDLPHAAVAADYIGTDHHEVRFSLEQVFASLSQLIWHLETWDITTIRAAVGMYLVCQTIRQKTPVRALLTGELSDEIYGYKYTDYAPNALAFATEARKRVREVYAYDVLRADRCIAAHGLEARVPFADRDFLAASMAIAPNLKMNHSNMGKALLREAFAGTGLLPDSLLYRDKAAFSDAVGHGVVDALKAEAQRRYSDRDLRLARRRYPHGSPISKEALWYRDIFEQHFPGRAEWIPAFWMPNPRWAGCKVNDPSARELGNYRVDPAQAPVSSAA